MKPRLSSLSGSSLRKLFAQRAESFGGKEISTRCAATDDTGRYFGVDYFNGRITPQTNALDALLGSEPILIGDLILTEVLQGFRQDAEYRRARLLLDSLELRALGGCQVALPAADSYRMLRRLGITPRKTIDMIIATYCLVNALELLRTPSFNSEMSPRIARRCSSTRLLMSLAIA